MYTWFRFQVSLICRCWMVNLTTRNPSYHSFDLLYIEQIACVHPMSEQNARRLAVCFHFVHISLSCSSSFSFSLNMFLANPYRTLI